MNQSVVLDTAVGLVFVFLTASLICTGVLEWISNKLNKRGEYLLRGLREMLDLPPATPQAPKSADDVPRKEAAAPDLMEWKNRREALQQLSVKGVDLREALKGTQPGGTASLDVYLADMVLAHPLVAALHRPAKPGRPGGQMHLASYLSGRTFAASLIDLLVPDKTGQTTISQLTEQVEKLPDTVPAKAALLTLLRETGITVQTFRTRVEDWYDEQMGRVSGWYKRWAQRRLLIAGLLLAAIVNVDTVKVAASLYHDQPVRNAVVAQALSAQGCPQAAGAARDTCLRQQQAVLAKLALPLGWDMSSANVACRAYNGNAGCGMDPRRWMPFVFNDVRRQGFLGGLMKLLGWLLTGLAVSLGAPFWFDSLSKLGSLRTAGRRPGETAPYTVPSGGSGRVPGDASASSTSG